jgi:peroxiredoxin
MQMNAGSIPVPRIVIVCGCLVFLMVPTTIGAQESNSNQSSDGTEALQELREELRQASLDQLKRLREARSDEEREALERNSPYRQFEPRFLRFAREFEGDEVAVEALQWIVETANPGPVLDQALGELEKHYLEHEAIESICRTLVNRRSPGIEPFLRSVAEKHPVRETQGLAWLSLAQYLASRTKSANNRDENLAEWKEWAERVFRQDIVEWMLAADPVELSERLDVVCATIVSQYGDLPDKTRNQNNETSRTLGDAVAVLQFSLDPVGRVAPEFAGEDTDGNSVSAAALQGELVLLMFSADWCVPCKEMYGQLRELTEIYTDEPFTVVTVMADQKPETVTKAVQSGDITWPTIWEGPEGPIASAWHVTSYPTIYLIGPDRRIVGHGLCDDALDIEIAKRLGIDPTARVQRDKRTRVWSLSFRDQQINDDDLPKLLEGYTELRVLDLRGNDISDKNVVHLLPLKKLTSLDLIHTGITDDGLRQLEQLSNLEKLYLDLGPNHKTTNAGRRALREAIPGLRILVITE